MTIRLCATVRGCRRRAVVIVGSPDTMTLYACQWHARTAVGVILARGNKRGITTRRVRQL